MATEVRDKSTKIYLNIEKDLKHADTLQFKKANKISKKYFSIEEPLLTGNFKVHRMRLCFKYFK